MRFLEEFSIVKLHMHPASVEPTVSFSTVLLQVKKAAFKLEFNNNQRGFFFFFFFR